MALTRQADAQPFDVSEPRRPRFISRASLWSRFIACSGLAESVEDETEYENPNWDYYKEWMEDAWNADSFLDEENVGFFSVDFMRETLRFKYSHLLIRAMCRFRRGDMLLQAAPRKKLRKRQSLIPASI